MVRVELAEERLPLRPRRAAPLQPSAAAATLGLPPQHRLEPRRTAHATAAAVAAGVGHRRGAADAIAPAAAARSSSRA